MPRTDENGRGLQQFLIYELDRQVTQKELVDALGFSRNFYYSRNKQEDFPNAEECRRLGEHFGLNFIRLMLDFGIANEDSLLDALGVGGGTAVRSARRDRQGLGRLDHTRRPRRTGRGPLR